MSIKKIDYVPLPFSAPRFTPDTRALAALAERQGNDLSLLDLQKGRNATALFDKLGELWSGYHAQTQAEKQMKAALAQRQQEHADTLKEKDADREERAQERAAVLGLQIATARQAQYDKQFAEAKDTVMDTAPGPISDTDPRAAVLSQLVERFPQLQGRFGTTPRLEANPLPGTAPLDTSAPQMTTRIPTGVEQRQAATDAAAEANRVRDDLRAGQNTDRAIAAQKATEAHMERMEQIASNKAAAASAGYPGNWDLTGDDFLKSLPAQDRDLVKKIANYDLDPSKTTSMRGNNRERMMAMVSHLNPAYDQSQFALRAPTRKAYTIGTQGQQINAINTALGHIDQLDNLVTALGNKSFVPGNALSNWASKTFGENKVTNFDTLKDALSAEVASVLSKGQATVSEIAEQRQKINAANSPAQLVGYIKTSIPIMGAKLGSLDYQNHQAMGPDDTFSALSPLSKSILEKHGFDYAAHSSSGESATPPAAGGVKILSITPVKK